MPKPKGTPLTEEQKQKMHAGLAAYHQAKKDGTYVPKPKKGKKPKLEQQPSAVPLPDDPTDALSADGADYLAQKYSQHEKQLVDRYFDLAMSGDKTALKWLMERRHGKPGTVDDESRAQALLVKIAVPGWDPEVTTYLAGLPDEKIKLFDFDATTLAAIEKARAS